MRLSSRNEELVGLVTTSGEMQTLQDVYESIDVSGKVQKQQTLWRDLTSELYTIQVLLV